MVSITVHEQAILDKAAAILDREAKQTSDVLLTSPWLVKDYLRCSIETSEHECFYVVFLDTQNRVIESREMFRGTIDFAAVHPREIVKAVLRVNAAQVIFAHNHPSGHAEPSQADRKITDRLVEALKLIQVGVLDHFVIGKANIVSFAERGYI